MFEHSKKNSEKHLFLQHQVSIAVFFLSFALLSSVIGFSLVSSSLRTDLRLGNTQINSLIDEVGQLQIDNFALSNQMESKQKQYNFLLQRLSAYNDEKTSHPAAESNIESYSDSNNVVANVKESVYAPIISYPSEIIDILILGTHGGLSDTILTASVYPSKKTITFHSIPRDFSIQGRKINEIYTRYGIEKLKEYIFDITGITIDRYVVIDMQAFVESIDNLGGVNVYVEKNIVDASYPLSNGGYTTFSISEGEHRMDGALALQYVRSRKSTSDFDRASRQQTLMKAVFAQVQSSGFIEQVESSLKILESLHNRVQTDVSANEALIFLKQYQNFSLESGNVFSTSNYLYSTKNQRGQYILLPKGGDYSIIQEYVRKNIIE
ncbi:LCP family protein [Candidatus Peregrinibacteria bacterium]|nr:LCP family protein [Candidatus Peregrinibacteria bacterium]